VPYCLHVPTDQVVAVLRPVYDRFLREALAEAQKFPEDWPELVAVVDAGCPPLGRTAGRAAGVPRHHPAGVVGHGPIGRRPADP
jgi:hypothetical protein